MLWGTILTYDLHNTKKRRSSYLYRDIVQFLRQYMFRNGGGSEWNGLYEDCSSIRFFFCRDAMLLKVVVFPVGLCAFLMSLWFPYNREQSSGREQVKQSKKCGDGLESKPPYLSILLFLSHSQKSKAKSFLSTYPDEKKVRISQEKYLLTGSPLSYHLTVPDNLLSQHWLAGNSKGNQLTDSFLA